jgi:small-conductance mechanosensitive channel
MKLAIFKDLNTLIYVSSIIVFTIIISFIFNYFTNKYIKKNTLSKHIDPTSFVFAKKLIIAIIYIVGLSFALIQIPELKTIGNSLLAGAGILSVAVGLASQQTLSNIISGFLIVLFKPFRINDKIILQGNYSGIVEEINLRQVVIRDFENNRVIVPNSLINSQIVVNANLTDEKVCKMIEIGISYSSDIDKAMKIIAEEVTKHPLHVDNRTPEDIKNGIPEVITRVISLSNSSVIIKAWAYAANTSNGFIMYCDLLKAIKERFDKENIEIPYTYQNIIIKNLEQIKPN